MSSVLQLGQVFCHVGNDFLVDDNDQNVSRDLQAVGIHRRRFWKGAEEILKAKYLQKIGIVKSDAQFLDVRGICIQVSKPGITNDPHVINFGFQRNDDENEIIKGQCSCTGGALAKCKHAVALLIELTKKSEAELECWSSTDDKCYWRNSVKAFQQELSEALPAKRFCHPKSRTNIDSFAPIPESEFESSEEYSLILSGFSERAALVKHIVSRNTVIEGENEIPIEELSLEENLLLEQAWASASRLIKLDENRVAEKISSLDSSSFNFYRDRIRVEKDEAVIMNRKTKCQNNLFWRICRQVRITGSVAHELYTYANNTMPNWMKKCEKIFFPTFTGNSHTRFGTLSEEIAKNICEDDFGKGSVLKHVGFIVCVDYPWLGFSPDAFLIENNEFILIECKSLKKGTILEGIEFLRSSTCLKEVIDGDGQFVLKKRNKFFSQIQLGLFVCNLRRGKLLLYNDKCKKNFYIDVDLDINYVKNLVQSLTRTYFNHCLPYLCSNEDKLF